MHSLTVKTYVNGRLCNERTFVLDPEQRQQSTFSVDGRITIRPEDVGEHHLHMEFEYDPPLLTRVAMHEMGLAFADDDIGYEGEYGAPEAPEPHD